jgi:hypothetical protein
MNKNVAFIIGNGPSRKEIDLNTLVGLAPTYGCNAIYRDFPKVDYLIAMDDGIVQEIKENFTSSHPGQVIVPTDYRKWESPEYSPVIRRANAGMLAMEEAIERGAKVLYCIGFDFMLEGAESTGNVYEGTQNYGPETHASELDNVFRMRYLSWFINKHDKVKFVFVFPVDPQFAEATYIIHCPWMNIVSFKTLIAAGRTEINI